MHTQCSWRLLHFLHAEQQTHLLRKKGWAVYGDVFDPDAACVFHHASQPTSTGRSGTAPMMHIWLFELVVSCQYVQFLFLHDAHRAFLKHMTAIQSVAQLLAPSYKWPLTLRIRCSKAPGYNSTWPHTVVERKWSHSPVRPPTEDGFLPHIMSGSFSVLPLPLACSLGIIK